ncbi:hypothetical protein T4D_14483 [Trichinella pseudospiralis]|uniref:Uncharacterized protein n=1 Tax=Trichinella pseudospiralis TaxID=6337 RepID=A0A0V1DK17_TRIPS|nr:hypothetical protein T4D_14483 [Trichinella pseudospiralis]
MSLEFLVCKPYCAYNSTLTLTQLNLLCLCSF